MTTRPSGARRARRLASVRSRLSFANLTALLALFVALGGSSYAAVRVGSEEITNNSVRSQDLRNNDVRGRDIRKGTVRGTDIHDGDLKGRDVRDNTIGGKDVKESSLDTVPRAVDAQMLGGRPASAYLGGDAATLGGKPASAFLGSDKQVRTGLTRLAEGQTKTIAASGPFTWRAGCAPDGGTGDPRLTVTVESTEANSFAGDFGGTGFPVSPGSPATVFDQSLATPVYTIGFPLSAVAPSGAAPVGLGFVGLNVLGADCVVNGILWP
ncbi:MAG TPA: hypothetical protein VHJ37_04820 [Thermoleophilaceae bacterium]|jgi:hypothetical protein|nr:hypothetical protein [Thermoleophilaceae bacterium]